METSVEQQLLTCQEIEQKVSGLSAPNQDPGGPSFGASDQESADLLSSELELLKAGLMSVQRRLEERQSRGQQSGEKQAAPAAQLQDQGERPLVPRLQRSGSVQEMFSSPRNKLLRQSSIQQQKELEQELMEQRGLTRAIARQHSRGRLHSQDPEVHSPLSPWPFSGPSAVSGEDSVRRRWEHLHNRLLALEDDTLPSPAEKAADSSVRVTGGMTGGVIDTQLLKDLQTHILRLEELGFSAEEIQGVPDTGSHQRLDEGVFDLLCGTTLSLSSLNNQMKSPPVETHMEEEVELHRLQLQSLSAELASLGHGLASQGSKVMGILGSEHGQQCLDLLSRVLPVVQTGLTDRLRQCAVLLDDSTKQQRRLKELHAGLGSNQSAVHQLTNKLNDSQDVNQQLQAVLHLQESIQQQASKVNALLEEVNAPSFPVSIPQQASQIQGVFDGALEEVCSRGEELRIGAELQRHRDRLVVGLKELVSLGSERLSQCPSEGQHGKGELEQRLGAHTKFFQSLGSHLGNLQYLVQRVHNGTPQRWEGEVTGLQEKVARLQEQALERGTKMEHTLQVWVQWEEACSWLDNLLIDTEPLIPKIHMGLDSEEEMLRRLSVYQNLSRVLEESRPRFRQVLEAGLWLKGAGCSGVGVVTQRLETCWNSLHRRVEQDRNITHRNRKLQHRFTLQLASLSEWMGGARELIDRWKQSTSPAEQEPFSFPDYRQFMELSKELEAKSELNASAVSTGTLLCGKPKRERGHGDELTYTPQSGGPEPGPIPSLLSQLELDWSCLQNDVSEIQKTLHQGWMERLGQQGALVELNAWLSSAEARLMEHCDMQSYNKADLSRHLHCYKDCQREMHCHQATLDYINHQVAQICSTMLGQVGRYEAVELAEKQGFLNQRWLSLEWRLNSQIQEVATCLRTTAERQERMQQISSWTNSQRNWLNSALSANSQSEVAKNIHVCEDLQEKIEQKSSALQQLGDQLIREDEREDEACSLVDAAIESCTALSQQNGAVRQRLTQVLHHWDRVEKRLGQVSLETMRKAQTLCYHGNTQPSLQAQGDLQKKLQRLHEEALALDTEWTGLSQDVSLFQDNMSPAALALLTQRIDTQRARWVQVRFCVDQARQRGGALLEQWRVYAGLAGSLAERLNTLQEEMVLVGEPAGQENAVEQIHAKIRAVGSLQERTDILQTDLEKVRHACKNLMGHLKPMTSALVQSESRLLSRGVLQLSQSLAGKLCQLQEELGRLMEFDSELESLERHLQEWQDGLMSGPEITYRDQSDLLETCGLTSDLDALNELSHTLTLGGAATHLLQKLNHGWAETTARAMETCSVLQGEALRQQSFDQKCESWTMFLQRMEESLAVDLLGSYTGLRQQLRVHQRFQAEFSIGHQILHSVISEALVLLQRGEVDDRSDFLLKLAQLREHWQGALQRAAQRRSLVEGLVKHWHLYSRSLRKLQHFLSESQALLPPAGPPQNNLQQLRRSLQDLQHTALLFQRYQYSYIQTLEVGRHLFSAGDQETQDRLQSELGSLQEDWDHLHGLLGKRLDLTRAILQNWERCEARLDDSMLGLKDVKTRLNQSMPEYLDDLQSEAQFYKENQDCLEDWAESLSELASMKTDLSQYIMADDVLLLQEQVEHLHCQWEDLCLQVSMRKQEIADRLNAWIVFNEKNKELCDWLAQMEDRVAYDSDVTIEDMVEKLKKDCMEEINLFSENKSHLKQLGEQLISASNRTKETEVNDKLKDVTDRWQHLFDHIETRVRKLKETLLTIQQLDKNMSNLRTWLSRIEAELSKPVVYHRCHGDEIQKKLSEQQELQRDIEQHTEGVASVLTLCDVLLHDADACVSEAENDSIQQTSRSLDRRWRNICAMSMERRMRIEETWRLWCKFLDDYARFEDWLRTAEVTAANPMSADVLYTIAKEELKRFEAFQRQVHERLTQLELVNKQYRRLARENRTDAASKLKVMVQEGNRRWDILQRRVSAVLRRLKHFTSQREDFEGTREGILVWLTEMDLQLTNVEHFSESDVEDKMKQLNVFQKEITLNTNKIDALIVFGENLIQKSASLDAVLLEDELEELHSYCQEVFGRVARFHQRLLNRRPVLEEDRDLDDLDDSGELASRNPWGAGGKVGGVHALGGGTTGGQVTSCHLLVPPLERSGRETPVSVDSIPLEWDHTVDVGGSSSHEEDEDATFFSALSDVKVIEGSESFLMATARAMVAASVKSVSEPPSWHQPSSPVRKPREGLRGRTSSPKHTPTTPPQQQGYTRLMSECSGSINSVKRVKLVLNDEEELEETGLSSSAADKHTSTGVIERWELFQAQTFSDELDNKHALEQWKKLNSDLCDVTSWLGRVLPELERLQRLAPSTSLQDIEGNICRLKEMQRTFNSYKCLMISVNLSSRHLQRGDSAELAELQDGLHSANHSWTQACAGLQSWETCLRRALLQCQEFHETLHSTLLWLARAENKLHAVNIQGDAASHSATRDTLMALEEQLHSQQQQVTSLQDISSQLLLEVTGEDGIETKEKVHVISNKLRLLLRQVASDLHTLQGKLQEATPTSSETDSSCLGSLHPPFLHPPLVLQKEEVGIEGVNPTVTKRTSEEKRDSSPPRRLFFRVLRAAFPLHLLFLLLLVLACLVPMSEEPHSCTLSNNFARSFYPMLRYTNGPPPT